MNIDALTGALAGVPIDWLILGALALIAAVDILRSGARRICVAALALPVALLLFSTMQDAAFVNTLLAQLSTPVLQAALIGVLFVVMYIIIGRLGLSWGDESGQVIQAALGGVAFAVVVATFWLATPELASVWKFGAQTSEIFSEQYRFFWILGSYGIFAYIRY